MAATPLSPPPIKNTLADAAGLAAQAWARWFQALWDDLRPEPWQTPTMQNGWVNDFTRCRKGASGVVYLELGMHNGKSDVPAFVLPPGYAPGQTLTLPAYVITSTWAQQCRRCVVDTSGNVSPFGLDDAASGTKAFCAVVSWSAGA